MKDFNEIVIKLEEEGKCFKFKVKDCRGSRKFGYILLFYLSDCFFFFRE